jgi:hypothetical protein
MLSGEGRLFDTGHHVEARSTNGTFERLTVRVLAAREAR